MHAWKLPVAEVRCSDASKAVGVIGPVSVWQCRSASCQLITAQPAVFPHADSHVATVADSSPNGTELWSASWSFATAGPAASMPGWHTQPIPAGVGAGGTGGDGGNPAGVGGPGGWTGGGRVQFAAQVTFEQSGPTGGTGGCARFVRGRMGWVT